MKNLNVIKDKQNNIKVEITLTSQAEKDFFGTLFNFAPISDFQMDGELTDDICEQLYLLLEQNGANIHRTDELSDFILIHPGITSRLYYH